jgi:hypothetical protein
MASQSVQAGFIWKDDHGSSRGSCKQAQAEAAEVRFIHIAAGGELQLEDQLGIDLRGADRWSRFKRLSKLLGFGKQFCAMRGDRPAPK